MSTDADVNTPEPQPPFVRDSGDRNETVAENMQQSRETGICPFCKIVAGEDPNQPVILCRYGWAVINCASPEEFSGHHFIVMSEQHPPSNHYDDLADNVRLHREYLIETLIERFDLKEWGYSVVERRGYDGQHTAGTVYHPCFHIITSDAKPVTCEQINAQHHSIIERHLGSLVDILRTERPEKAERLEAKSAEALYSEALRHFVRTINLYRSFLESKAGAIWVKLSNEADAPE